MFTLTCWPTHACARDPRRAHLPDTIQVVSELLSIHVLKHYDKFVEGINQISEIEEGLQEAHILTKNARKSK